MASSALTTTPTILEKRNHPTSHLHLLHCISNQNHRISRVRPCTTTMIFVTFKPSLSSMLNPNREQHHKISFTRRTTVPCHMEETKVGHLQRRPPREISANVKLSFTYAPLGRIFFLSTDLPIDFLSVNKI